MEEEHASPSDYRKKTKQIYIYKKYKTALIICEDIWSSATHTFSSQHQRRLSSYSACHSCKGFCKPVKAIKNELKGECHPTVFVISEMNQKHCDIQTRYHESEISLVTTWITTKCKIFNLPTLPMFASRSVSLLLMCFSMLVSPLDMRNACQNVRAPRATPAVLKGQSKFH